MAIQSLSTAPLPKGSINSVAYKSVSACYSVFYPSCFLGGDFCTLSKSVSSRNIHVLTYYCAFDQTIVRYSTENKNYHCCNARAVSRPRGAGSLL